MFSNKLATRLLVSVLVAGIMAAGASAFQISSNVQGTDLEEKQIVETIETFEGRTKAFGSNMFTGAFAKQSFAGFNPTYAISVGDRITLRLWGWGGDDFEGLMTVDAQGNIFVPKVGPVRLQGILNADVNKTITAAVSLIFKKNVGIYASLDGAEPVKIFVTGFVRKPGLYAGHSSDSVLYFLDKARGIDNSRGSFLDIKVLRGGETYKSINLYDFVLHGQLPLFQLADGDTIVVAPVQSQVGVYGEVQNENLFEFRGASIPATDLLALARPQPHATHMRISRNSRAKTEVDYIRISEAKNVTIAAGDVMEVVSDKTPANVNVRVVGEHSGKKEFILPYGANLGDLLQLINFSENAQPDAIQLQRESVRLRQKEALEARLRALESRALTANSSTANEAQLRATEAQLYLQFIERARTIEPKGLVTLGNSSAREGVLLEAGDVIIIPRKSNLLQVHGEVLFPSAMVFEPGLTLGNYIDRAGGFSQGKRNVNIVLAHRDGSFEKLKSSRINSKHLVLHPGDEIFVLPRVRSKNLQFISDISAILFQLVLSAGTLLRL